MSTSRKKTAGTTARKRTSKTSGSSSTKPATNRTKAGAAAKKSGTRTKTGARAGAAKPAATRSKAGTGARKSTGRKKAGTGAAKRATSRTGAGTKKSGSHAAKATTADNARPETVAEQPVETGPASVALDAEIAIADARELYARLQGALAGAGAITVDGSQVEHIDTAGLQLLARLVAECKAQGWSWTWQEPSHALRAAAETLDLVRDLALPN